MLQNKNKLYIHYVAEKDFLIYNIAFLKISEYKKYSLNY